MTRKVAAHIASRFSQSSPSGERALLEALHSHYFPRQIWGQVSLSTEQWLATPEGGIVIFDDLKRFARDTVFHLKLRQELATYNATVRRCRR